MCIVFRNPNRKRFFLQFLKENVLLCQKKCIFWHGVRTFLPQIKICMRVSKKMMPIPKTYVLTLNKKNKIFFQGRTPKKFNGIVSWKLIKSPTFFMWQKFLADFLAGVVENLFFKQQEKKTLIVETKNRYRTRPHQRKKNTLKKKLTSLRP